MRADHKGVFFRAAQEFQCWIGLREPNPLAEKWIGRAGYIPKIVNCKAKTADHPAFGFAGLVVDPTIRKDAFHALSLNVAIETWRRFLIGGNLPVGFTKIETGPEQGLVKYRGSYIYSDYDLMAINRSNERGEFLQTSRQEQATLFTKVEATLNRGFGTPMVQHGSEFDWDKGVGAREYEMVFWFGPGNRFNCGPSSMPHGGH